MQGQLSLFDKQKKAPVYHVSLNHVWEECPDCKAYNKATSYERGIDGKYHWRKNARCPVCGLLFDWSEEAVERACIYTKEYIRAVKGK